MRTHTVYSRTRLKAIAVIFMLLTVCFLAACEKSEMILDASAFDDAVQKANPSMFYDEAHEHDLRYKVVSRDQHLVYCANENCGLESYLEAHGIKDREDFSDKNFPHRKENGCYYHSVNAFCYHCDGGRPNRNPLNTQILCNVQDIKCQGDCYTKEEWREIICMQYEIYSD